MKKYFKSAILAIIVGIIVSLIPTTTAYAEETGDYKSIYVIDYDTGTVIQEENADERYPIASMVKIMTLAIAFDEINKGNLSFEEKIRISDYAAGMGGSQLFLDADEEYSVSDLLKGIVVCSANDAATAIGERISGNIDGFVSKMNAYAKELGMNNTLFCNATGLPNSGEQYSTAKDVSIMMRKVLSYPEYFNYSKIWMEDYKHPDGRVTQIVNTNKLLKMMPECDGGKTGFTNEAGFCLSATARKGDTRVIATILGCSDSKNRFRKISESIKYAFANYETNVYLNANELISCEVNNIDKAKNNEIEIYCDKDIKSFCKKGTENFSTEIVFNDDIKAPVHIGEKIGKILLKNSSGEIISSGNIYTNTEIEKISFDEYLRRILYNRFFR